MEGAGERASDEMLGPGCIGCASDKLTPGAFHHTDIPGRRGKGGHGVDVEMEAAWIGSRLGRRRSVWYITTANQEREKTDDTLGTICVSCCGQCTDAREGGARWRKHAHAKERGEKGKEDAHGKEVGVRKHE
jgi:hypothetical protein